MNEGTPQDPRTPGRDGDHDIDAEFARLMQGAGFGTLADDANTSATDDAATSPTDAADTELSGTQAEPSGTRADLNDPGAGTPAEDAQLISPDSELTVDDILAAGDANKTPPMAVIVTPIASAKGLAGLLRIRRDAGGKDPDAALPESLRVIPCPSGAIAVASLDESTAHRVGELISRVLVRVPVALFWRRGDQMTATRYHGGERGDDVPPALVLGACDDLVEDFLLGVATVDDRDDAIDPFSIGKMQALAWIASAGRRRE
ncbi:hypothetical protein [Devriesea agamarum]|uniref:hypothetical protein n=1 Tax=Devriesea agamarum TaxID=472569 RepID=UPI00071DC40D|nr:hypothetical protein [Devriesea agamarum]